MTIPIDYRVQTGSLSDILTLFRYSPFRVKKTDTVEEIGGVGVGDLAAKFTTYRSFTVLYAKLVVEGKNLKSSACA